MISPETRDYILKLAAWVAAVVVCLPILASVAAVFYFGDGEGIKILGDMTAPIFAGLATFVSVLLALLGHLMIGAHAGASAAPASPSPSVTINTPAPVTVGQPQPAPAVSSGGL